MIQSEEYRNRELYTKGGLLKFDENGMAEVPDKELEKKLVKMYTFDLVDTKVEEEEPEEKKEDEVESKKQEPEEKPAPAKTTTRKKTTTRTTKTTAAKDEK